MLIADLPHFYIEEDGLHAMIISKRAKTAEQAIEYLDDFLPHVIDVQTCDALRMPALAKRPDLALPRLREWSKSLEPYTARFAIMTLLRDFSGDAFTPVQLDWVAAIGEHLSGRNWFTEHHSYRVRSAVKRYFTYQLVHHYADTSSYFDEPRFERQLHNEILQSAASSKIVSPGRKSELNAMKI